MVVIDGPKDEWDDYSYNMQLSPQSYSQLSILKVIGQRLGKVIQRF